MQKYYPQLKKNSRLLRSNMTDAELLLWSRLRRKQILGVQFYRQKPIGNYIVDFFAPLIKLIIEADGSQHFEERNILLDRQREKYLISQGFQILRFNNLQILKESDFVMEVIFKVINEKLIS